MQCVCALCCYICKLLCKIGRLETENRDVLWLSSDPHQTVTSPSTQGMLGDKMFCCYSSMATLQTQIHGKSFCLVCLFRKFLLTLFTIAFVVWKYELD